jgi:hypothetical protein
MTPRNPRQAPERQARKSEAPLDASLTLRDILLKVGEAGTDGANGSFDFDLLGTSFTASSHLSFARLPAASSMVVDSNMLLQMVPKLGSGKMMMRRLNGVNGELSLSRDRRMQGRPLIRQLP